MSSKAIVGSVIAAAIVFGGVGWWSAERFGQGPTPASADDMHALLGDVFDIPGSLERSKELVRLAHYVDDETIPGVARAFEERLDTVEAFEFKIFAEVWAKHGPGRMLDVVNQWESLRHKQIATNAAVYAWVAEGQIDRAISFVEDSADPETRLVGQIALLIGWVELDPDRSLDEHINSFEDEKKRGRLTSIATSIMVRRGGEMRAWDWINRIPDAMYEYKTQVFDKAIQVFTNGNQIEIAQKWIAKAESEYWASNGYMVLARTWAGTDPIAATEWASDIKETKIRTKAVNAALKQWEITQPIMLADWIEQQEPSDQYDPSLKRLALRLAPKSPKRATALAERITSEDQRAEVLERVVAIFKKRQPRPLRDAKPVP